MYIINKNQSIFHFKKEGLYKVDKGELLGKYIRILVVMLTVVGLSALLHLNEADAVTKGKVIEMKEISQQHHHVIQIKPAHVTHMRTHRSTSLQPTSTQYGKHTRKTSNHVVINYSQQHYTAQPKGATFSKQTNQYKKRTTTTVKSQKTTKPVQPLQKKPHWLSQATKIKKVSPTLKVTKAKTSRASTVTTKMKTTKSNVKVSAKTVKQPTQLKAKPKSSYLKPKKNYYNQPPKAWSSNVPVVTMCVISVKLRKNQVLMML